MRLVISLLGAAILWNGEPRSAFEGHAIFETRQVTVPDQGRIGQLLVNGWFRWDTGWYLKIAALGYASDDGTIIFPPLYPLLIHLLAPLMGYNYLLAALLISSLCCLSALILFYEVALDELGEGSTALRAVVFLVAFPTAFFLLAGYSEALFLSLSLAVWFFAKRQAWILAGIFAGLAVLARLQGWLLMLPLAWLIISIDHSIPGESPFAEAKRVILSLLDRRTYLRIWNRLRAGAWAILALPPLALAGYMVWLRQAGLGDITTAYDQYWTMDVVLPWQGFVQLFARLFQGGLAITDWIDFGLFLLFFAISLVWLNRQRPAFSLYIWATFGLMFMRGYSSHLMAGYMRYLLTLFPVFLLLAAQVKGRFWTASLVAAFTLLQIFLLWAFLNWFWVA